MKNTVQKVWNAVSTVLVALIACVVLALLGLRLFGLQGFVVLSGSMEPTYHTGSMIYVKSVDETPLEAGEVITFHATDTAIATHRIIEVVEEGGSARYRTQGDANEVADGSLVKHSEVIGTPVFSVPYLGYALTYIQSPPGMYVAIAAGAMILLLIFLPGLIFEKGNGKKSKTKEEQQ